MKELYNNYYEEGFSQSESQQLDIESFELNARKFKWNYERFLKDLPKKAKILDFGCGLGQFLFYLKKEGFENSTGIDISQTQVQLALQMQPELDIRHVDDSLLFLKSHPQKYDFIVMNDVLEHFELNVIVNLLKLVHFALKTDGLVIIKTINSAYPLSNSSRYIDITHNISFHERSLTHLLSHAKFIEICCYQEEIGIYNAVFLIKKGIVSLVRLLIKIFVYFTESDWPNIISVNIIVSGKK